MSGGNLAHTPSTLHFVSSGHCSASCTHRTPPTPRCHNESHSEKHEERSMIVSFTLKRVGKRKHTHTHPNRGIRKKPPAAPKDTHDASGNLTIYNTHTRARALKRASKPKEEAFIYTFGSRSHSRTIRR